MMPRAYDAGMARRRHPVYKAYVEAWTERRQTGNTSDAVLLDALARHPVPEGSEPVTPQARELLTLGYARIGA
jgi:hypothetical protein